MHAFSLSFTFIDEAPAPVRSVSEFQNFTPKMAYQLASDFEALEQAYSQKIRLYFDFTFEFKG